MSSSSQGTLDNWLSRQSTTSPKPSAHSDSRINSAMERPSHTSKPARNIDSYRQNKDLAIVAKETRTVLPDILADLPHIQASKSEALFLNTLPPLKPSECPRRTLTGKVKIKVVNDDTFNAAIALAQIKGPASGRVAVLNMASYRSPGGGWLKGARAQEEALCYRSSLALSLHRRYYPWKQRMGLYTPDVVIIRSDMESGHNLFVPGVEPKDLEVVSALSIAALNSPLLKTVNVDTPEGSIDRIVFANPADRELTKDKMRLCLRMAARRDHGLLVLGALGCGAFHNPQREVATCWLEVLRETEFQGGWWEEVWFAIYDKKKEQNMEVFEDVLGDEEV